MEDLLTYPHFMGLASVIAAALGIYLAFTNQKGAAFTMAAICVATGLLSKLEYVKSFEAFTIKAQLQDRIEKADELIKQLRELSALVVKAGYASAGTTLLAFGSGQASGISMADDFDRLMRKLKFSDAEMLEARQPMIRGIGFRIAAGFINICSGIVGLKQTDEARGKAIEANKTLSDNRQIWELKFTEIDTGDQMRRVLRAFVPVGLLPDQRLAVDSYIEELVRIYEACQRAGTTTPGFIAYEKEVVLGSDTRGVAKGIFQGKLPD